MEPEFDAATNALLRAQVVSAADLVEGWTRLIPGSWPPGPPGPSQGLFEQRVYLLLGDVQTAKLLIVCMEPARPGHLGRDEQIDPLQFGQEVLQ